MLTSLSYREDVIRIAALALVLAAGTVLSGCDAVETKIVEHDGQNKFSVVQEMGVLDGCTVKYVTTTVNPNFYFIKCPDAKNVSTYYDTGGNHPTRIGAGIKID